jgi:hypothetical protein
MYLNFYYVQPSFNFFTFPLQVGDISVFETNIRYVGGLLTLFAFTGDDLYRSKAVHVADKLLPAFNSPTGIPYALINMKTGVSYLLFTRFSFFELVMNSRYVFEKYFEQAWATRRYPELFHNTIGK